MDNNIIFDYDKKTKDEMIDEFRNFLYHEYIKITISDHYTISEDNLKQYIDEFLKKHNRNSNITFDRFMNKKFSNLKNRKIIFNYKNEVKSQLIAILKNPNTSLNIRNTYNMLVEKNKVNKNFDILDFVGHDGVKIDWHNFVGDNYDINLMFATEKEKNFDMCSISNMIQDLDNFNIDNLSDFEDICDNALTYLIHSQGYTLNDFYNVLYNDCVDARLKQSPFLNSIIKAIRDIKGFQYCTNELTVLTNVSKYFIEDFVNSLVDNTKDFYFYKANIYRIELFNEWQGVSSDAYIILEKDLYIPTNMLKNWQMENVNNKELNNRYTVASTCIFTSADWIFPVVIKNSKNRPKMIEEDYSETFNTICKRQSELEEQEVVLEN